MQITLKQSEIEIAVTDFISKMGINLTGKAVEVSFTAGRKEDGLSASLDITEVLASAPTLGTVAYPVAAPVEVPAQPVSVKRSVNPVVSIVQAAPEVVAEEVVEVVTEPAKESPEPVADEAPKAKVNSLFG